MLTGLVSVSEFSREQKKYFLFSALLLVPLGSQASMGAEELTRWEKTCCSTLQREFRSPAVL